MLYAENSIEFYLVYYAALVMGCIVVPVNSFLHEQELAHVINDCNPRILFFTASKKDVVSRAVSLAKEGKEIFLVDDYQVNKAYGPCDFSLSPRGLDELSLLLYTSGTSGQPKGVMLSARNMMSNVLYGMVRVKHRLGVGQDRYLALLPLFHSYAQNIFCWTPLIHGDLIIVVNRIERPLIRKGFAAKPTLVFGFPALYGLFCQMKNLDFSQVRSCFNGADAMPNKIKMAFEMIYGRKIGHGYGLTESSPVVASEVNNGESAAGQIGMPLFGIEMEVRDKQGNVCAPGDVGLLWTKSASVMKGYYKAPELSQKVLVDGWLNTGDLVVRAKNGTMTISGREKDLIIHKGFNIYPIEIENVLMTHKDVFKAALIGLPDDMVGQIPVAFIAVKKSTPGLERAIKTFCRQHLAAYKIPRRFVVQSDLPLTKTGKVDKKNLIKHFAKEKPASIVNA